MIEQGPGKRHHSSWVWRYRTGRALEVERQKYEVAIAMGPRAGDLGDEAWSRMWGSRLTAHTLLEISFKLILVDQEGEVPKEVRGHAVVPVFSRMSESAQDALRQGYLDREEEAEVSSPYQTLDVFLSAVDGPKPSKNPYDVIGMVNNVGPVAWRYYLMEDRKYYTYAPIPQMFDITAHALRRPVGNVRARMADGI